MDLKKDIIKLENKNGLQQVASQANKPYIQEVGISLKIPTELNKRLKMAVKVNKIRETQNDLICEAIEKFLDNIGL